MGNRVRPYVFYDVVVSICSTCYRKVEGKIIFQNGAVYMTKRCPSHGDERVLMADDVDYYRRCREVFIKVPEMPRTFNTPVHWGCPYDCGLCADHQQHSCLSLIEITDHCNLQCPICYAESGPSRRHPFHGCSARGVGHRRFARSAARRGDARRDRHVASRVRRCGHRLRRARPRDVCGPPFSIGRRRRRFGI